MNDTDTVLSCGVFFLAFVMSQWHCDASIQILWNSIQALNFHVNFQKEIKHAETIKIWISEKMFSLRTQNWCALYIEPIESMLTVDLYRQSFFIFK